MTTELEVIDGGQVLDEERAPDYGSEEWATRLRRRAVKLSKDLDRGYMRLAKSIWEAYDTPRNGDPKKPSVVTFWGYDNVDQWAEEELRMDKRKARYLKRIYYRLQFEFAEMDAKLRNQIVDLGYSSVRELIGILTMDNAKWVHSQCVGKSWAWVSSFIRQLRAEHKAELKLVEKKQAEALMADAGTFAAEKRMDDAIAEANLPPQPVKLVSRSYRFHPDQFDMVDLALETAGKIAGSNKKSYLLSLICMDYLATNGAAEPGTNSFRQYIANLEALYGRRLIVVNPHTTPQEVEYGVKNLLDLVTEAERAVAAADDDIEETG